MRGRTERRRGQVSLFKIGFSSLTLSTHTEDPVERFPSSSTQEVQEEGGRMDLTPILPTSFRRCNRVLHGSLVFRVYHPELRDCDIQRYGQGDGSSLKKMYFLSM